MSATDDKSAPSNGTRETAETAVPETFRRDTHAVEFGRVLALSDGVFAIALTLLVLDLALPENAVREGLGSDLADRQSHFISFAVSLVFVGSAWWSHHRLFSMLQGVNGNLIAMNIVYMGLVVLLPFAQSVLTAYSGEPFAYVIFAGVLVGLGIVDTGMFAYAGRVGLHQPHLTPALRRFEARFGVAFVVWFLLSMPVAFLLGAFTIVMWLLWPAFGFALIRTQGGPPDGGGSGRFASIISRWRG